MGDAEQALQTARMVLEPLLPRHAERLSPLLGDAALYTYLPQEPPASLEEVEARYRRLAGRRSPDGAEVWLNWAARLRETEEYVGTFQATVRADATALIAYMIFTPFQRRGLAREGCAAVLASLAGTWGVRTVAAEIDTRNAASVALVESLAFARSATLPGVDYFKGASSDEYRYEWHAVP
jgi:RimJ/RimL family protein N-acetyltransferase